ncbi:MULTISPECIES: LytR/AlgR family response regulator transcription factor [Hungatella]|uniref:Stage 0 sporulation protein A homolog n=1 Tax=Hungatella hathewayi TaxID=154046 RepID=A0AAW9WFX4_9FIRM|nr:MULTISPECIES: LytTR family DNA-binding domain-containing protein [Hungatella]MCD7964932.1 LytTR family DNA-binding domain-containing protein [Clostridiaceae bacterium]MCD7998298.1 LytTR family DNA-binding domain-containing protein [Clostridiales bacterium]MCQ4828430.1 LytTR family DNA-binding domain-containing protein [Hungatella sp. SL.1.14]MUB63541.1 response regulator [Hungatella hathewayi]CUQ59719.1 DNA-binding response regulator [Hungatella hathewayi]
MYHFAICEDEKECLNYLAVQIIEAFKECGETIALDQYSGGRNLIDAVMQGRNYDVLFLDIVMPDMDGFEICRKIRTWESDTLVVFISSNEELVFQSFEVQPFNFLRKNKINTEIGITAKEIQRKLKQKSIDKVTIIEERSGKLHILPLKETLYVEAQLRCCRIRLKEEEIIVRSHFSSLEKQLISCGFIKVHRSYLVNYRYIYRIENQEILLDGGIRVPISRDRIGDVKMEFMIWNRR